MIEDLRTRALQAYQLLDTPAEDRFDELARLAADVCGAPIALMGLADDSRVWFKSEVGAAFGQTPLQDAFCSWTLTAPDGLLVVPDAHQDPRFAGLGVVVDAGLRFYAGVALAPDGGPPLGTLCVLDAEPRPGLTSGETAALRTLARQVVAQLELRRARLAAVPAPRAPGGGLEAELRRALAGGELVLHHQPLWEIRDGERQLVGAEALVRWEHPTRGLLAPGAFLPEVAHHGLDEALGEQVLQQALAQLARWQDGGTLPPQFRMHVNIAPAHLHTGRLPALLERLAATGAPVDRLCLEITETSLLDERAFPLEAAERLVATGVRLVLDDFGTGYSSLALLREYPLAGVKVDRSFVQGLGRSRRDEAIVRSVVALARDLGLGVVCEGVENLWQLREVLATGCREVQGYLLGRPVAAREWDSNGLLAAAAS